VIAHSEEKRKKALQLLKQKRSLKEISSRTGVSEGTIEAWSASWRKDGNLVGFNRPGSEFTKRAKLISNGYYKSIRKRYLGMKWQDQISKRIFGFQTPVDAIKFYLDESGNPRPCSYCGRLPEQGKVWGLDRLDSSLGHCPGNLVPCCGSHPEGVQLSCQASKSKYSLSGWMEMNIARALGRPATKDEVQKRVFEILKLAKEL
jgi:hypothetical protein